MSEAAIRDADRWREAQKNTKTLEDEFAMAALPALIAKHRADVAWGKIAPTAYEIARAMMAERTK